MSVFDAHESINTNALLLLGNIPCTILVLDNCIESFLPLRRLLHVGNAVLAL